MHNIFRRHIALPQDHGSWVFLFSPLAIGLVAGKAITPAALAVIFGATAAFLLRQPITVALKIFAGRRPRGELAAALSWSAFYALVGLLTVLALISLGFGFILWLGVPGVVIFACHLYFVSKRAERGQMLVEILATGALALVAPAAFWAAGGHYDAAGWWLWLLTWLQSSASIVYVYVRLTQRGWVSVPSLRTRFEAGFGAFGWALFNLTLSLMLGLTGKIPSLMFLPYFLQFSETLWGIFNPANGAKPVMIGMRQLAVSTLFTLLFALLWR